jgi:hypothetical protein
LVEQQANRQFAWVPSGQLPQVEWAPLGTDFGDRYGEYIDLRKDIGLRIWVRQGADKSTVLLHFHHACSDALGGFAFIEDLLAGYANAGDDPTQSVVPRPIDFSALLRRGTAGMTKRTFFQQIGDAWIGAREGIKFFSQAPRPLKPVSETSCNVETSPQRTGYLMTVLSDDVVTGLRRASSSAKATVNDLLLRDFFTVLSRWNRGRGRVRILMPQSLRAATDHALPAANIMSFAFITRRSSAVNRPVELLESIRRETDAIRRFNLSVYFLGALASLQSARLLQALLRGPFCFSTAVLTNMSDPTRRFAMRFNRTKGGLVVGNLVFQAITGVPPLRPRTRAAVAISHSGNALYISLKADPRHFCPLDAQQLLGDYVNQLEKSAALGQVAASELITP